MLFAHVLQNRQIEGMVNGKETTTTMTKKSFDGENTRPRGKLGHNTVAEWFFFVF